MYPPDPDGEGPVHEGDNGLHLLEPEAPEVPPAPATWVLTYYCIVRYFLSILIVLCVRPPPHPPPPPKCEITLKPFCLFFTKFNPTQESKGCYQNIETNFRINSFYQLMPRREEPGRVL